MRARRNAGRAARSACVLILLAAGCAGPPPAACLAPVTPADPDRTLYLVQHGWHDDLVLPMAALRGDMAVFRQIFPAARFLLVGFGKRSFMMAPVTGLGDLLIGPFPGNGTILAAGLTAPPDVAYGDGVEVALPLSPQGAVPLSDFIWQTLRVKDGRPVKIGDGFFAGSIFYATRTGYSGWNTCNSWAAQALHAAGEAVDPDGVVFAGQVTSQAARAAGGACAIAGKP